MKKIKQGVYYHSHKGYDYFIEKVKGYDYKIYTDTKSYGHFQCATAGTLEGCKRMVKDWHKWRISHNE